MPKLNEKEYNSKFKEALANDPDYVAGRKAIFLPLVILVASRLIYTGFEIFLITSRGMPFSFQNVFASIAIFFFAFAIYQGLREFILLPVIGVAASLLFVFEGGTSFNDGIMIVYSILFYITLAVTVIIALYVFFNKKYRIYADKTKELRKSCVVKRK